MSLNSIHRHPADQGPLRAAYRRVGPLKRVLGWLVLSTGAAAVIVGIAMTMATASTSEPVDTLPAKQPDRAFEILPSEVFAVERTDLVETISVVGTLSPVRRVDIAAQVSGMVHSVAARPGEAIQSGAELVTIDVQDLALLVEQQRATLSSAVAQHEAAVINLKRKSQLAERELLSKSDLQAAETEASTLAGNIAAIEAQLQQAETNLARSRIAAPFDGIVAMRAIEPGQAIGSGATLMTLVDQSKMVAEVAVPLMSSARIQVGQAVQLSVRGLEGQTFPASVERINPVAEDGTRSVKLFLTLDNPEGLLRGGMFVTGEIQVAASYQVLAVPESAVTAAGGEAFAVAIRDGVARRQPVVPSRAWPELGLVEIREGLQAGDMVLAMSLPQVGDGSPVQLVGEL